MTIHSHRISVFKPLAYTSGAHAQGSSDVPRVSMNSWISPKHEWYQPRGIAGAAPGNTRRYAGASSRRGRLAGCFYSPMG
eukprot:scaffold137339_cov33-Tisochrysis_lutea.AAC.1